VRDVPHFDKTRKGGREEGERRRKKEKIMGKKDEYGASRDIIECLGCSTPRVIGLLPQPSLTP
jgi:hypothetical protein